MTITARAEEIYGRRLNETFRQADRIFAILMPLQYAAAVLTSLLVSPLTYEGTKAALHPHLVTAILMGGLITLPVTLLAALRPGGEFNRYMVAIGQMLMGGLLIHVSGGRIESHFHIFVSLAFLAVYRDWTVLLPATVVVATDHFLRGIYLPVSIYGVASGAPLRVLEHASWVVFEDMVLIYSIRQSLRQTREGALHRAQVEEAHQRVAELVAERTEALMRSEAQAATVVESALDGILTLDSQGRILTINPAAEGVFGMESGRMRGREFAGALVPPEGERIEALWLGLARDARAGSHERIERDMRRGDGEAFAAELTFTASGEGADLTYIAFVRDMTERRRLEASLSHARKMEGMGELATGIAHEINTPNQFLADNLGYLQDSMGGVWGVVDAYRQALSNVSAGGSLAEALASVSAEEKRADFETLRAEIPPAIQESLDGVDRVRAIVRAMKEMSHPGTEVREDVDLNRVVYSTLTVARHEWKNVAKVEYGLEKDLPCAAANQGEVGQVLLNVVVNAIHAIAKARPRGMGVIRVSTSADDEWVTLRVEDDGCGIEPSIVSRIFDPFFTTKGEGVGTGQGLAISKGVIERFGGEIRVESTVGVGTRFDIVLPRARALGGWRKAA